MRKPHNARATPRNSNPAANQLKRKRGRPPDYVHDRTGRPIVGLSYHKSTGQYYTTHVRPPKYFGTDYDVAVMRFRRWQDRHEKKYIGVPQALPTSRAVSMAMADAAIEEVVGEDIIHWPTYVPTDAFYAKVRRLILENPVRFAEQVGIPQVANLQDLGLPERSLTLEEVGAAYFNRKRRLSEHWRRKQKLFWNEFSRQLGAKKTLREVTRDDIARYHDAIWSEFESKRRSPTFLNHRIAAVRTILRHALREGRDNTQIRRVIDLTQLLETAEKNGTDPSPISRGDLAAILNVASPKWRAAILLSLNAALYPSELADVKKNEVDLDRRILVMRRRKTGSVRIAVLWERTVAAIREYQQANPHEAESLFVNKDGRPYNANHVSRNWRRLRKKAGVDDSVEFAALRDAAYSSAIEGGADVDHARLLAGHRLPGVTDAYIKRNPTMVADACAAIEAAHFSDEKSTS